MFGSLCKCEACQVSYDSQENTDLFQIIRFLQGTCLTRIVSATTNSVVVALVVAVVTVVGAEIAIVAATAAATTTANSDGMGHELQSKHCQQTA